MVMKHQRGNLPPAKGKRKRESRIPKSYQNLIQKVSLELAESIGQRKHLGI